MYPDRAMWTVGLVLAGTVLAGLVLNLTTGLTRLSWAITLAVAVVACACVGLIVRRRGGGGEKAAPVRTTGFRFSPLTGGFLLLTAVLAGGAVWLGQRSVGWQHSPGFAQLWLVPAAGTTATLGVRDDYAGKQAFVVVLTSSGKAVETWKLTLAAGETWQRTVTATAGQQLAATLTTATQVLTVTS
jgi:hypothetical protein